MIITVEDLKKQINCGTATDEQITIKLKAIESVIRAYTNNNFQQRIIRFVGRTEGMNVYGSPQFFAVGDTVQISCSGVNDGLYQITHVQDDYMVMSQKQPKKQPLRLFMKQHIGS